MRGRDGRTSGAWLQPSLRVALPAALAAGAAVLVARLVSLDAAIVIAPVVTVLAIALVVGRASTLRKRQMGRIRRRLRQRMDAQAERQARLVLRETARVYAQLEALAAIRDTLDGRISVPSTRDWAASADLLRELAGVIMTRRPTVVVETGSGTSTVIIAACLERLGAGHLWSLEHLASYASATRELLASRGLAHRATVVDAPLVDVPVGDGTWSWYDLEGLPATGPIELLFVDGPPGDTGPLARYPALPALLDRLAPGATIIVDDGSRPDEREMVARWCAEVPGLTQRSLHLQRGGRLLTLGDPAPTTV